MYIKKKKMKVYYFFYREKINIKLLLYIKAMINKNGINFFYKIM